MTLRTPFFVTAAAALALAGCAPPNPTGPDRNQTRDGAVVGAALGAIVGAATAGDDPRTRREAAITGAVLGGAAGAAVGYSLDRQEAELRAALGDRVLIRNTGSNLVVTLPQDILFDTDSATLTGALQSDLRALSQNLNAYPGTTVTVIGHTDNVGAADYNQNLSRRRAQAVTSVLISSGVAPERIRTLGQGESAPIADNLTPEGRRQNRRVEIVINPPR